MQSRDRLIVHGKWIAEAREPDGTWTRISANNDARILARTVRRWRQDRDHLAPETRIRAARVEDLPAEREC